MMVSDSGNSFPEVGTLTMATAYETNLVAYSIASEIINDMVVGIKDNTDDDIEEDSDTDTDGICIIVPCQAVTSAQTLPKCDDYSNESSDDTDKYVDTVTSTSEDTTIDDEGKDVFVDAEEETSPENRQVSGFSLAIETKEEVEFDNAVRETLDKILEMVQSEEMVSSGERPMISSVSLTNNAGIQPNQIQKQPEATTVTSRLNIPTDNPGLPELEDLDGEIEYYDSCAVFSPFDGGPSVICATATNCDHDRVIYTASEMFNEGSYGKSGTNDVPYPQQDYENSYTTPDQSSNIAFEYPISDNFADASQYPPISKDFHEGQTQSLERTPEGHCQSTNGFINQFNIVDNDRTLYRTPRQSDGDLANTNEIQGTCYVPPYKGQHGDADISFSPCENPSEITETWYDPQTSADVVETQQAVDADIEKTEVPKSVETIMSSNTGILDIQGTIDTTPTSTNESLSSFPNSSLNPECEPFVPMQYCNGQYTAYSNADNSYQTSESHSGVLTYDGPPHLAAFNTDPSYSNHFYGETFMFPVHHCTNNGYLLQQRPYFCQHGLGHPAYPVYPRNILLPNANPNDTSSFQQTDQTTGPSNQHLQFPNTSNGNQQIDFRYPAIYLSEAGLITVLLRHDFSVEMTTDQVLRAVNHKKKLVALISSQGTESYVFHPAARVTQDLEAVEVEVFLQRKVKMKAEAIVFANNFKCYKFDYEDIEETEPEFSDLRNDLSVDFLFASQRSSDIVTQRARAIAEEANIEHGTNGSSVVRINGVKIVQNERGEVSINSGPKFIRMFPNNMSLQLKSNFLEVRIGINWSVKVCRGPQLLNASHCGFIVTNGRIEAGFDDANKPFACLLPRRVPLLSDHRKFRRRHGTGNHIRHRSKTPEVN